MPVDRTAAATGRRPRVAKRLALAGRFGRRRDRFVADIEIPFGEWVTYAGGVNPDVPACLTDAA